MARGFISDVRSTYPEMVPACEIFEKLAYAQSYAKTFHDLLDYMLGLYVFKPIEQKFLKDYSEKRKPLFNDFFQAMIKVVNARIGLYHGLKGEKDKKWDDWKNHGDWYDPLGRLYETIASNGQKKAMGQYFTPDHLVNLLVRLNMPGIAVDKNGKRLPFVRVLEPTCGSGRMGIAAAAMLTANGVPNWITMVDLDQVCTKMATLNMCMNGFVGEVLCMDGLDMTGASYRFGYKIVPMKACYPEAVWNFTKMMLLVQNPGQDPDKLYTAISIPYDQTFLKVSNDHLLKERDKAMALADERARLEAIKVVEDKVKARMKNTLFDGEASVLTDIKVPAQKKRTTPKKKKSIKPITTQNTLF